MQREEILIGRRVRSLREFNGVPLHTEGVIIEDYGTGIMVAWDKQDKPYLWDKTPQQVAAMWAVQPECPIRDGFDYSELRFLEVV